MFACAAQAMQGRGGRWWVSGGWQVTVRSQPEECSRTASSGTVTQRETTSMVRGLRQKKKGGGCGKEALCTTTRMQVESRAGFAGAC